MSTGFDLLQRLRKQRQEKGERQSTTKDKNEDTQDVQKKTSPSYLNAITTIEVCLGPDCSGGGGGAALLEIEDLVSCREKMNTTTSTKSSTYDKINNKKKVVVVPGGCTSDETFVQWGLMYMLGIMLKRIYTIRE